MWSWINTDKQNVLVTMAIRRSFELHNSIDKWIYKEWRMEKKSSRQKKKKWRRHWKRKRRKKFHHLTKENVCMYTEPDDDDDHFPFFFFFQSRKIFRSFFLMIRIRTTKNSKQQQHSTFMATNCLLFVNAKKTLVLKIPGILGVAKKRIYLIFLFALCIFMASHFGTFDN